MNGFKGMGRVAALSAAVAVLPAGVAAQAVEATDQNDRAVHAFASAVDFGEVQQSMLATQRASNAQVRAFAQQMITDHTNALHTREMLMQTENSGLLPRMAHGSQGGNQGGLPPAYGPGNSQVEVNQNVSQRSGSGGAGAVGVATQGGQGQGGNASQGTEGTREGGLPPAYGPGNSQVEVNQNVSQRSGSGGAGAVGVAHAGHGNAGAQGQGNASAQGNAHASHQGMAHGQGHAMGMEVTPEMVQQLTAALTAHPMSRPVMEANARNLQVLMGLNGPQFDVAYMDAQIGAHQYALQNIDRMLSQGDAMGDDIRGTMQMMRTAVAAHLQMAQQIRAQLR